MPADAGDLIIVHGWALLRQPITASIDGLLIIDSLGGDALAERLKPSQTWQEFTVIRSAPTAGPVTVTFALTGLGEARLDDVSVARLSPRR